MWRRSLAAAARLLAVQGVALAALVVSIAAAERGAELLGVAAVVLALKGVVIPLVVGRGVRSTRGRPGERGARQPDLAAWSA